MTTSTTDPARGDTSLNVVHIAKVVRRRWWAIALCVILTPVAAFVISKAQHKQYTATASLLFTDSSAAQQASGVQAVAVSDPQGQRSTDLAMVQLGDVVAADTATAVKLPVAQIRSDVTASQQGQSNIVSVAATSMRPAVAATIANTYARSFVHEQRKSDQATVQNGIDLVQQQYASLTNAQRLTPQGQSLLDHLESLKILKRLQNDVQVAQAATVPTSPSSPRILRNTMLGFVLGVLLACFVAFLLERVDRRLREPEDIEETLGLPILGLIPRGLTEEGATTSIHGDPRARERFRILRAHLRYFNVDRELRTLVVTSSRPAEGKTTIASHLAATAAVMGTRTLLIEADLRKPVLASRLGLMPGGPGLGRALVTPGTTLESIQSVAIDENGPTNGAARMLDVLPAGDIPPNPTELLESHAMKELMDWARTAYEIVVVDTTPLAVVADAIPLMKAADGVIVVSRVGVSTRDVAEGLRERLANLNVPVLGVVINSVRERGESSYGYGYYGYAERPTKVPGQLKPPSPPAPEKQAAREPASANGTSGASSNGGSLGHPTEAAPESPLPVLVSSLSNASSPSAPDISDTAPTQPREAAEGPPSAGDDNGPTESAPTYEKPRAGTFQDLSSRSRVRTLARRLRGK